MQYPETYKTTNNNVAAVKRQGAKCAYCMTTMGPELFEDVATIDNGSTALCPECRIDALIPIKAADWENIHITVFNAAWFNELES